ncbi:NAD-dependent deacylase [Rhodosalinus sp.]|uniref:NAD-dependent deacylase n=1 Tax=Rhodosalinus sp. TaxID=2047741 RepID=UPI0035627448
MRVLILTGAGISADSGLGTFRDAGGLWTRYPLEEVATPEGWRRDPAKVMEFYNARRAQAAAAVPNPAHEALARLEAALDGGVTIVTQNVDSLHEAAGARNVIHMHGRLDGALCAVCEHRWPAPVRMAPADPCPACGAPATRPDVVWFGEMPYRMEAILAALSQADLFVSIGTSGEVYPAAGFVEEAAAQGIRTLELNLEASRGSALFDEARQGPASTLVPVWVAEMLGD